MFLTNQNAEIVACILLSAEELLFLRKTFECIARGDVQLETDDGYYPLPIMGTFYRELFND